MVDSRKGQRVEGYQVVSYSSVHYWENQARKFKTFTTKMLFEDCKINF
jgi:hypothetical protein